MIPTSFPFRPWRRLGLVTAAVLGLGAAPAQADRFTAEQIADGNQQFHRTCAQCHGRNMISSGVTVFDLRKFPTNDPARFRESVTNGKGNMPSFKEHLTPQQIDLLWAYVGSRGGKEP